ncbi:hypothetical protein J8J17_22245, partial [Mycobacterium tuberculosis]|nr:hypothetical protein [Mycobacterium tuberculosis]
LSAADAQDMLGCLLIKARTKVARAAEQLHFWPSGRVVLWQQPGSGTVVLQRREVALGGLGGLKMIVSGTGWLANRIDVVFDG